MTAQGQRGALLALSLAGAAIAAIVSGCQEYGVPAGPSPHLELNFLDMADQPKIKAQRGDLLGGPEFAAPQGAIPRGFEPYPFPGQPDLAASRLLNPLHPEPKVLERGKILFERFCVPCHGERAAGDGTVIEKGFPAPPSLMTAKTRAWTDGRIYHVMAEGQNIMPSYATQLRPEDRWAVIHHLRKLQSVEPVAPGAPELPAAPAPSGSASANAPASAMPATSAIPSASASPSPREVK